MGDLDNEYVLITGAAGRIGRATAAAFAKAGAHVMASDIDEQGLRHTAKLLGKPHRTIQADLSNEAEILALVDSTVTEFGRLTSLVNCGASTQRGGTVMDSTTDALDHALAINTRAPFLTVRQAIPHMLRHGGGAIVNVASIQGLIALPGFASYAVSKIGLIQLTKQIAVEYGRQGIRCNAICPGSTRSLGEPADDGDLAQFRDVVGRVATSEEIAHAIAFLASSRASFINGAIIPVDGGYTAH